MGIDRNERSYQGHRQSTGKNPYAAIEHRILDSETFANITPSAVLLMLLLARQLNRDNNGHLQATFSFMSKHGMRSEHTLSRSIAELIAHNLIYRTRAGGYRKAAALYALTWLPIKNREGLYLDGFKPHSWRDWKAPATPPKPRKKATASVKFVGNGTSTAAPTLHRHPRPKFSLVSRAP